MWRCSGVQLMVRAPEYQRFLERPVPHQSRSVSHQPLPPAQQAFPVTHRLAPVEHSPLLVLHRLSPVAHQPLLVAFSLLQAEAFSFAVWAVLDHPP